MMIDEKFYSQMTVRQLIRALQDFDQDNLVVFNDSGWGLRYVGFVNTTNGAPGHLMLDVGHWNEEWAEQGRQRRRSPKYSDQHIEALIKNAASIQDPHLAVVTLTTAVGAMFERMRDE